MSTNDWFPACSLQMRQRNSFWYVMCLPTRNKKPSLQWHISAFKIKFPIYPKGVICSPKLLLQLAPAPDCDAGLILRQSENETFRAKTNKMSRTFTSENLDFCCSNVRSSCKMSARIGICDLFSATTRSFTGAYISSLVQNDRLKITRVPMSEKADTKSREKCEEKLLANGQATLSANRCVLILKNNHF